MESVTPFHGTPVWFLILLIVGGACALGLVIYQWRCPTLSGRANQTLPIWISLVLGLAVFLCIALVFNSTSVVRTTSVQTATVSPSEHAPTVSSSLIDDGGEVAPLPSKETQRLKEVAIARDEMARSAFQSDGLLWLGVVSLGALLVGIAIVWSKLTRPVTVAATGSTNVKSGLGWLIVPIACLAVLGTLAAPKLIPPSRPANWSQPAVSSSQQERMDKAVRDLIASASSSGSEVQNLPKWIKDRPESRQYQLLSSGQYSSRQEGEAELLPIAADLLQRAFHEHHPWQGAWNVPLAQVRERVVELHVERLSKTIGEFELYRVHMLVNLTPEVCETFTETWKSQIVEQRLKVMGLLLAWLSCVFLLASAYYRSLAMPGLAHRWAGTIKVTVLTIGVTALAAWVLVTYIP